MYLFLYLSYKSFPFLFIKWRYLYISNRKFNPEIEDKRNHSQPAIYFDKLNGKMRGKKEK